MRNAGNATSKRIQEDPKRYPAETSGANHRGSFDPRAPLWFQPRIEALRKTDYGIVIVIARITSQVENHAFIMNDERRDPGADGVFHGTSGSRERFMSAWPRGNGARRKRGSRRAKSVRLFAASSPT